MSKLPFALSIPHGGKEVPHEFVPHVIATSECTKEDVDHLTQEICGIAPERVQHVLSFDTSRTYVDLNRPPHAYGEEHPDGVVKRKTHLGKDVFRDFPTEEAVQSVLNRLYHPYHRRLQDIVSDPEVKLTLDCHSMSPVGLSVSPDSPGQARPAICLGHKAGGTASLEAVEALREIMSKVYDLPLTEITIDKPFNGGYITRTHGSPERPIIQIEFSRGFYMKDQVGSPEPNLPPAEIKIWQERFTETLERLAKTSIFR